MRAVRDTEQRKHEANDAKCKAGVGLKANGPRETSAGGCKRKLMMAGLLELAY